MTPQLTLRRAVTATRIPYGDDVSLESGSEVSLVQSLGGHFTVDTYEAGLVRIDAKDADALGLEAKAPSARTAEGSLDAGPLEREAVLDALREVYDPEIPINVVDLGLIYDCVLSDVAGGKRVEIRMSMTAPGCGMGDVLREDVRGILEAMPQVREVDVEIVWDPPWSTDRMSEAAKLEMGWL